ncbi:MAG: zinc ribbon domain-containing protein [Prevotella sp.]|nr:zinc ribbon domain-containing protein [Prevotella sp.]
MAIIKCPECGHQISEKATVCPICGVEIAGNIVRCTYCGEVYFKDDGICPHCYRALLPHGESRVEEEEPPLQEEAEPLVEEATEATPTLVEDEEPTDEMDGETPPPVSEVPLADNEKPAEAIAPSPEEEKEKEDEEEESEELPYIDTDEENLEKPIHDNNDTTSSGGTGSHKFIPITVSLAITALIAAVCLYFYNDSKLSRETQAFQLAINSGNVNEMNSFLRTFTDASEEHKQAIHSKIEEVTKQKEDLSMSVVTRDKDKIMQFLSDYPDTPLKSTLLSMVDSIDWETALASNKKEAYEKYVADHANGLFAKEAKDKINALAVKVIASTAEDAEKARFLFREFFLSVNGNDASRLTATLGPHLSSFMGTSNAGNGDVVSWMRRQHGENVSNVIWKLNHDYKITKLDKNGVYENTVEFTAKKTVIHKDGHTGSEHFKVIAIVTDNNKVSSMSMTKYTPKKEGESTSSNSSSNNQSGSTASSKPTGSSQPQAKTSSSGSSTKTTSSSSSSNSSSKTTSSTSSPNKPNSSSNSSSKTTSSTSSTNKPSSSNSSKTASSTSSNNKPSGSSNSSKTASSTSNTNKPSGNSSSSKSTSSTSSKPSGGSSSPKSTSSTSGSGKAGSGSGSSKPSNSSSSSKPSGSSGNANSSSKPSSTAKQK